MNNVLFKDISVLGQILDDKDLPISSDIQNEWIRLQIKKRVPSLENSEDAINQIADTINDYSDAMTISYEQLQECKRKGETTSHWLSSYLSSFISSSEDKESTQKSIEKSVVKALNSSLSNSEINPENKQIETLADSQNISSNFSFNEKTNFLSKAILLNPLIKYSTEGQVSLEKDNFSDDYSAFTELLTPKKKSSFTKIVSTAIAIDNLNNIFSNEKEKRSFTIDDVLDRSDSFNEFNDELLKKSINEPILEKDKRVIGTNYLGSLYTTPAHTVTNLMFEAKNIAEKLEQEDIGEVALDYTGEYAKKVVDTVVDSTASAVKTTLTKTCESAGTRIGAKVGMAISSYIPVAAPVIVPVCTVVGKYTGKAVGLVASYLVDKGAKKVKEVAHKVVDTIKEKTKDVYNVVKDTVSSCISKAKDIASSIKDTLFGWI